MYSDHATPVSFLNDGGQMGALIRQKDWSETPLGPPETWPVSLQTTVSILLNSRFPMFVWWGPELTCIYNDSYIPIAGEKHPRMLGRSGREAWAEIWKDLAPLVDSVFAGTSTWSEDQLLLMNRYGYEEETYFTFSYSPVRADSGPVSGLFCACIETTEKVLANRRIAESERNFRNMILQAPVAMCILLGPQHVVDIANETMIELWGKPRETVIKRPIFEGLPDAREQGLEKLLHEVYHSGISFHASERPVDLFRNGRLETVYQNFVYEPYRDSNGQVLGVLAISVDVTDMVLARQQIEELVVQRTGQLADANDALTISNQELTRTNLNLEEFAYAASHDMKEPIRKIHFFADRLKSELQRQLNAQQLHLFDRLEQASRRMGALIDDLLTYSQATRGAAETEQVDLNQRLEQVLHDLELEIDQKGARVVAEPLPVLQGNGRQFQQMLQNLVSNGLKYGRPGVAPELRITARSVRGAEMSGHVPPGEAERLFHLLQVRDNGIGFAQKEAERIFNVFTRLQGNTETRGTGVGLSIVRKVAENHGGYAWAEGRPGDGATFFVMLPVQGPASDFALPV